MKISFIIPAFNEEKYISKCLRSIIDEINNSHCDAEIIVVNNASTDRTGEIARSFSKVKVIDESKKGTSSARQAGFLASSGDILAFIDSDVILPKNWIKKVFSEFEKDKKLVAISSPYVFYDASWSTNFLAKIFYYLSLIDHFVSHNMLGVGAVIQGANSALRRDALKKIGGFDVSIIFHGDDTDLAKRIQKVGKVKYTFDLIAYSSARRLKKQGIIRMGMEYFINHLWILIFKRPFTKKYIYVGDKK